MADQLTLTSIVEEVNEKRLFGKPHCCGRRVKLCRFVADRQGEAGSYYGLPAPLPSDCILRAFVPSWPISFCWTL